MKYRTDRIVHQRNDMKTDTTTSVTLSGHNWSLIQNALEFSRAKLTQNGCVDMAKQYEHVYNLLSLVLSESKQ